MARQSEQRTELKDAAERENVGALEASVASVNTLVVALILRIHRSNFRTPDPVENTVNWILASPHFPAASSRA
jgi:hypothetical protein